MDKKKKIVLILTILGILLILILFVLIFVLKSNNTTSQTFNNNTNEEQSNKISLKVKADAKILKFNVSIRNTKNTEFNIEKSYTKEFNNPIELENSKNILQSEDDLTQDIEDNVEKCYYRVKVQNLETDEIKYSNVITIKLKKLLSDSSDEDNWNDDENNTKANDINEWNIDDGDSYIIIDSLDENEIEQINYTDDENFEIYNEEIIEEETNNEVNHDVEYIYLNETDINFDLSGYKETNLVANVGPSTAKNKSITWTSSNTQVATVDQNGKITAKANGTSTIIAQTSNGKSDKCEINVTTSPTSISLNKTSINLDMLRLDDRQEKLIANIIPPTSSDQTLIWTSSDENIVTVDSDGLITANSNGTATIKCETPNGKFITCQVNVATSGSGIYINKTNVILDLNDTKQVNLKAVIVPSNTVDKTITWMSSNPNIAYVDSNGLVTAKSSGTCIITAKTSNGKISTCSIKVNNIVSKITLNKTLVKMIYLKDTKTQISVTSFYPNDASDKSVKWTSSNPNVATINSNGVVIAKNLGKTTITATCGNAKATCDIIVKYNRSYQLYIYNRKTKNITLYTKDINFTEGDYYAFYMYIPDTERCLNLNTLPLVEIIHGGKGQKYIYNKANSQIHLDIKEGKKDYNAIIIFPIAHYQQPSVTSEFRDVCKGITDYVANNYKINKKKISIGGASYGAAATWYLVKANPGYYSAAYATSGWYDLNGVNPKNVPPIWIVYGGEGDEGGYPSALINFCKNNSISYKYTDLKATHNQHAAASNHLFKNNSKEVIQWLISK